MKTIYDYTVKDRKGRDVSLKEYAGEVILIVNTATRCGFTPQYTELEQIYEKYRSQGFNILDFPCNQFGQQAPGTSEEIHEFCQLNYATKFPQFKKIDVNGDKASPLFTFLKSQKPFGGFDMNHPIAKILDEMLSKADPNYKDSPDIKWNFTKFLIDKKGLVKARFEPTDSMEVVAKQIEAIL
jgi:glutathione peroxidase